MAFDPAFLDEIRARTPLASLIGRRNRLVRSGRNWKTCCPFHGEKTPSFYIYDDHFHCFGCGVHGDAISFVMQSEGKSFPEAVEELAGQAGLDMPKPDARSEERAREARSLGEVLELVQESYRRRLFLPEGRGGLAYLRKRGLSDETIARFGLGWSGDGRGLSAELAPRGVTPEMLARAGVMRLDEQDRPRGELFFNRVTFPIRDRKGRIISFGARTLGDGQPKYLNGPETALFSKRRTLFNLDRAREAVHKGADLVVVEGYMDVIALDQAGFGGAVAPLGTALGEEQLDLLWRMSPSPILCMDGDAAGLRSMLRVCEVALPLLTPGRTLRFCRLDPKDDPDSLIRREGAEAMRAVLAAAAPLARELFGLMTAGWSDPGPEQRAALREKLVALSRLIPDRALASEYRSTLLDLFFEHFRGRFRRGKGAAPGAGVVPGSVPSVAHAVTPGERERLNVLTALLLRHPDLLAEVEQAYAGLPLPPDLDRLRAALLEWTGEGAEATAAQCRVWLESRGVADLAEAVLEGPLPREGGTSVEGDDLLRTEAAELWWHLYGFMNLDRFRREVQSDIEAVMMGENAFPESLRVRMNVLAALKSGEMSGGET